MSWNYDEKDVDKEVSTGGYLNRSGCYIAVIKDLEQKKTTNGYNQIVFKFEIEEKEYTVYHTYEGKDGTIEFKTRVLNHLLYINKLTKASDIDKVIGKTIGVMLKAKLSQDKKYINFDLEDVYHAESGKTAKELKDKLPAGTVEEKQKAYDKEPELIREGKGEEKKDEQKDNSDLMEEFPF